MKSEREIGMDWVFTGGIDIGNLPAMKAGGIRIFLFKEVVGPENIGKYFSILLFVFPSKLTSYELSIQKEKQHNRNERGLDSKNVITKQ